MTKKKVPAVKTLEEIVKSKPSDLTEEELKIKQACEQPVRFRPIPTSYVSLDRDRHIDEAPKYSVRVKKIMDAKNESTF